MYGIVDASVTGNKTAQHPGVGRIYNGIHRQPGDIPLPQGNPAAQLSVYPVRLLYGGNGLHLHNPFFRGLLLQEGILYFQKFL